MRVAALALATLLLAVAAANDKPVPSMYASFAAFAACSDDKARALLEKRMKSFTGRSEEEVRALPEHVARNEQEKVLSLQQVLLPDGISVRLHGLVDHPALNGCDGVLVACLRDGSFLCAVETHCGLPREQEGQALRCRVHIANLRPATDCAATAEFDVCDERDGEEEGLPPRLDKEAVGKAIVDAVMQSREPGQLPAHFAATFPGETAFPDLSYASLAAVLGRMQQLACGALSAGDAEGAGEAIEQALDLEAKSRPDATADAHELSGGVRLLYARLLAVRARVRRAQGDAKSARRDALAAQRLNVTDAVSNRKLGQAMSTAQRSRAHKVSGLTADESARLQRWFAELLPLDQHVVAQAEETAAAGMEWHEVSPQG